MLEFQGWATLRESFTESGEDPDLLRNITENIKSEVEQIRHDNLEIGVRYLNGTPRLWVVGYSNHRASEWEEILRLYRFIASAAPGSYGELSFWDDEDETGRNNAYQLYVLRKGALTLEVDPFLSPCIPKLEDPD